MTNLAEVLRSAATGSHAACRGCPWNPRMVGRIAFGTSCRVHGVDWAEPISARSVQIVRDPGGTTPEQTGTLCFECNKATPSDRTAQNNSALWDAAVVAGASEERAAHLLRGHYWTNAVMHGGTGELADYLERARQHCTGVLRDQVIALRPRVIVASGQDAAQSLYDIGILKRRWGSFRNGLNASAYSERGSINGTTVEVFVTYHTSAGVVNRTVSKLYSAETEEILSRAVENVPNREAVVGFLARNSAETTTGKGLRVLLLHWIQIGSAIRTAA